MEETPPFTIESFYKYVGEKRLMAAKCAVCGSVLLPPRPFCSQCCSSKLRWVQIRGVGKLETYTIIHVASPQFQEMAPYVVGIVKLYEGPRLPAMIRNVEPKDVKVGMDLKVDFDTTLLTLWPMWPRYFFKPLQDNKD